MGTQTDPAMADQQGLGTWPEAPHSALGGSPNHIVTVTADERKLLSRTTAGSSNSHAHGWDRKQDCSTSTPREACGSVCAEHRLADQEAPRSLVSEWSTASRGPQESGTRLEQACKAESDCEVCPGHRAEWHNHRQLGTVQDPTPRTRLERPMKQKVEVSQHISAVREDDGSRDCLLRLQRNDPWFRKSRLTVAVAFHSTVQHKGRTPQEALKRWRWGLALSDYTT